MKADTDLWLLAFKNIAEDKLLKSKGLIKNNSGKTYNHLTAEVTWYDSRMDIIDWDEQPIEVPLLLPGEVSNFIVSTPYNSAIKRSSVIFKTSDGVIIRAFRREHLY